LNVPCATHNHTDVAAEKATRATCHDAKTKGIRSSWRKIRLSPFRSRINIGVRVECGDIMCAFYDVSYVVEHRMEKDDTLGDVADIL